MKIDRTVVKLVTEALSKNTVVRRSNIIVNKTNFT